MPTTTTDSPCTCHTIPELRARARYGRLVFVYGTLLRGEGNHARFLSGARFVSPARTVDRFHMISLGGFPALTRSSGVRIVGEVFEVRLDELDALDRLEGHPTFYRRTDAAIEFVTPRPRKYSPRVVELYVLSAGSTANGPTIESGDWREFQRSRGE